jgi:hypothetical protein
MATRTNRKSWNEKLHYSAPGYPKKVTIPENWAEKIGKGNMIILTPLIIDSYIKKIPRGRLATINSIREHFAKEYKVRTTCPITTGIFTWISAWAAEEKRSRGAKRITPYWRVLKQGGKLNPKYPGGVAQQAKTLTAEGFHIKKGSTPASWKVIDADSFLY